MKYYTKINKIKQQTKNNNRQNNITIIMINKLKNNKFLLGTILLLTGGFLSKLLGFILKIIITRKIGTEGIAVYSLVMPTFSLFSTIATFSFPVAISKITSTKRAKKVVLSIIPVSLLLNLLSILVIFIISKPLSIALLKEPRTYYPILSIGFTLPFIGLSSIIKGYYWGKQRMGTYILSNIVEQIVRIIIITILVPIYIKKSIESTLSLIVLVNILSETSSIIVMMLALPKHIKIKKEDLKPVKEEIKNVMSISFPSTTSKIIGSIVHFIEPILLTNILTLKGFNISYIIREYGVINGYSVSLLLLPQFFTQSISTSLVPEISKYYEIKDKKMCTKRIKQIVALSLTIGLISTIVLLINPAYFLNLIYKTTKGVKYIKALAPFFLLYFIETPLSNCLQAMNKSKEAFIIVTVSSIIKLFLIVFLSILNKGINSLIISTSVSIVFSTYFYLRETIKALK